MPGFVRRQRLARCPECDGPDLCDVGYFMHKASCSTQPGYEQARVAEDESRAERQRARDELVASPEAARLRALRQATRLA
jgi:hypothetical protein